MNLLERSHILDLLNQKFKSANNEAGHTVCITGEAGIGKTSVTNTFLLQVKNEARVYEASCDFLFSPRPLGPLHDIAEALSPRLTQLLESDKDKSQIFSHVLQAIAKASLPVVIVFEDIHWADEATLDLIKFLARRIHKIKCLFILTFRDDEVLYGNALRKAVGELPPSACTKLHLGRLSAKAVNLLAKEAGKSGDEVFRVSAGNPFFVKEILSNYNLGIPENIRDLVQSLFLRQPEEVQRLWQFISIFPGGVDLWLLDFLEPDGVTAIEPTLSAGIVVCIDSTLRFKHELYRAILDESLSALKKIHMHKKVLDAFLRHKEKQIELVKIVHHARNAHDWNLVEEYAPLAAAHAVKLGAHSEASKLYATAIEYSNQQGEQLAVLYEKHAYECYLIHQINAAIESQKKALEIWQLLGNRLKEGSSLRFISRLLWFEGKRVEADAMVLKAIGILETESPSSELAMAYSNYAQLRMLHDDAPQTVFWGNKALELASHFGVQDIRSHALNNLGTIRMHDPDKYEEGFANLKESLSIALQHDLQEHAARAYTNIISSALITRDYPRVEEVLQEGMRYCNDHDLDSWKFYKLSMKCRLKLEKGEWAEAEEIAEILVRNKGISEVCRITGHVVLAAITMRKGGQEITRKHFEEARKMAESMKELQRSVPLACVMLEYSWLYQDAGFQQNFIAETLDLFQTSHNKWHYSELLYWMRLSGKEVHPVTEIQQPYKFQLQGDWKKSAEAWSALRCPYHYALALVQGEKEDYKSAFTVLNNLGATATIERLKQNLRNQGMPAVPRGPRKSTQENPAFLTSRQIEILSLLKDGLQNQEIATHLYISAKTVDNHLTSIFSKLKVNSRTKAVVEATRLGILK